MQHWNVCCVSARVDGRGCVQLGVIDHRLWCSCVLKSLVYGADTEKAYAGSCISTFDSCYHDRVSAIAGSSCSMDEAGYSFAEKVDWNNGLYLQAPGVLGP